MSLALALPDAVAVAVVVTGGHAPAQAPLQLDMSPVSLTHRYTARPEPLVRKVPAEDFAVVMTVPPEELAPLLGEDAPAGEAGAAAEEGAAGPAAPACGQLGTLGHWAEFGLPHLALPPVRRGLPAPASRNSPSVDVRAKRPDGSILDGSTTYDLGHYLTTERCDTVGICDLGA